MYHKIESLIFAYGIIPMLKFLEEQEQEENYEICAVIFSVLSDWKDLHGDIPTKYSEEALQWQLDIFKEVGVSDKYFTQNLPHYVKLIAESVLQ